MVQGDPDFGTCRGHLFSFKLDNPLNVASDSHLRGSKLLSQFCKQETQMPLDRIFRRLYFLLSALKSQPYKDFVRETQVNIENMIPTILNPPLSLSDLYEWKICYGSSNVAKPIIWQSKHDIGLSQNENHALPSE